MNSNSAPHILHLDLARARLDWLHPDPSPVVERVRFVCLGILGAWTADALGSLHQEYLILSRQRWKCPDFAYILSRLTTGCFLVLTVVLASAPVQHCLLLSKFQAWAAALQLSVNALLLVFRICSLFLERRLVIVLFSLLWLGVPLASFIAPFSLNDNSAIDTTLCVTRLRHFIAVPVAVAVVNDALVFSTITIRLLKNGRAGSVTAKPAKTALLRNGQICYLTLVGVAIATAAVVLSGSVPDVYANIAVPVSAAITNIMTTRVYRRLRLDVLRVRPNAIRGDLIAVPFRLDNGGDAEGQSLGMKSTTE